MNTFKRLHTDPAKYADSVIQDMALSLATHICLHEKPRNHKACARGVVCVACQSEAVKLIEQS